ncbi:MAG: hypothetical protein AAB910_00145 [Patescibacteria group bacterium]
MAARGVPAALLWEALDEAEAECTLDRFFEWYRRDIAVELRKVSRPKVDKWNHWGNRDASARYRAQCEHVVVVLWKNFRQSVRVRVEAMIASHIEWHGDYMLMQLGGSLTDYLDVMLAEIEAGTRLRNQNKAKATATAA